MVHSHVLLAKQLLVQVHSQAPTIFFLKLNQDVMINVPIPEMVTNTVFPRHLQNTEQQSVNVFHVEIHVLIHWNQVMIKSWMS